MSLRTAGNAVCPDRSGVGLGSRAGCSCNAPAFLARLPRLAQEEGSGPALLLVRQSGWYSTLHGGASFLLKIGIQPEHGLTTSPNV